jgi:periplasmic protein TonB
MVADRQHNAQARSMLSRGGPAIAVIGIHVILIYAISASMGIVPIPSLIPPAQVTLIPEAPEKPDPVPVVEREIKPSTELTEQVIVDEPMAPQIEADVIPVAPSADSIEARPIVAQPTLSAPAAQPLQAKQRIEPTYPAGAIRAGEEGTVRLRVFVDERGRPGEVQVAQSSGFARLDAAALDAVRRWRFQAATEGGRAISVWTQVAITFKLTDAQRR